MSGSITTEHVWTYAHLRGSMGLTPMPVAAALAHDVVDLATGRPTTYWGGRVMCLGRCDSVFAAVLLADEVPETLGCPICHGPAIPEIHWGEAYESTCSACNYVHRLIWCESIKDAPRVCPKCGTGGMRVVRWPVLD